MLHKVVRNDGWPPNVLIMHVVDLLQIVCTSNVLSAAHDVRSIDLAQLTMNFDQRYALCIQKFITDHTSQLVGAGIRASIFNHYNDATVRTQEVSLGHAMSLLYHLNTVTSCNTVELRLTVRPINRHHLLYNFFHKFFNTLQSEFKSADGNIFVSYLPPNVTSLIQPMDQCVVVTMKRHYRREMLSLLLIEDSGMVELSKKINIKEALY